MLDNLSPPRRRLVLVVTAGVSVVALIVVGLAVRSATRSDPSVAQDVLGPVLVVPGYGGNVESVEPIAEALRGQGRDVVVVRPTAGGTGDLAAQAERLGEAADRAMEDSGADSVDVVGYSAGGVVARLWVRDEGGAAKARRVLTLGSPHHGTDVAALAEAVAGSCPTACEQLAPDSDLLRRLNAGDETPAGPRWITVRSDADRVVTPTVSASLKGALDLDIQELCPTAVTAHGDLPQDPVLLAALESALGKTAPRAPSNVSC